VKGTKHTAADGLSRRPHCEEDSEDDLDIDEFIALELDAVGIQPVTKSAKTVKPCDTKCDARPDWLEPDSGSEPCFSGRPRRGRIRNCPSPSSLRNQASRRNDIPDHMTRAEPQNPHAKVAKTHFT